MKTYVILILTLTCLVTACTTKSLLMERKFKEDKVFVKIDALKKSAMDPWKITMKVKSYEVPEGALSFEHQVSHLKADDVKFDWTDESTCIISFPYDDGKFRKFRLEATQTNCNLAEIVE